MVQQTSNQHFSDLQLLEDDVTAYGLELFRYDLPGNAAELNHEHCAPELDHEQLAPEADHEQWAPQVAEGSEGSSSDVKDPQRYTLAISKKLCWALVACTLVAAFAVAVGVGVGIGVEKHATDEPSASKPNGTISPPESTIHLEHGLAENSSFAIVSTSDGNRHMFFQELGGNVRQAFYNVSESSWTTSASFVVTSDAKNNTPISAFSYSIDYASVRRDDRILLAYTNKTNDVNIMSYNFIGGSWINGTITTSGQSLRVSPDSKFLSIGRVPSTSSDGNVRACLFLENPNGYISVFETNGSVPDSDVRDFLEIPMWDVSTELYSSLPTATFGTPFVASTLSAGGQAGFDVVGAGGINVTTSMVFATRNGSSLASSIIFANGTFSSTLLPMSVDSPGQMTTHVNISALQNFDVAIDDWSRPIDGGFSLFPCGGYWINGTTENRFGDVPSFLVHSPPAGPFPYSRLATYLPSNGTETFLYHQLNATVIAEDFLNEAIGNWGSNNITILTTSD